MKFFLSLLLAINVCCCSTFVYAAEQPSEAQLKAAYLYNFAKFITWPENVFDDATAPFVIGLFNADKVEKFADSLTAKKIRNRPVVIKHFDSLKNISDCHILYLGSLATNAEKTLLKKLKTKPVVSVADANHFAEHGGLIQFISVRNRLRFIINLDQANRTGIKIEAQLLSLAIDVLEKSQ